MRDTAPEHCTGYVLVTLTHRGVFQGFFVTPAFASAGQELLANARNELAAAPTGPEELRPGAAVGEADRPLVGLLSAALAQLVDRGSADGQPSPARGAAMLDVIGAAAWALVEAVGRPWLLVRARRDPTRRGMITSCEPVEARDVDEARERMAAVIAEDRRRREIAGAFEQLMRNARPPT